MHFTLARPAPVGYSSVPRNAAQSNDNAAKRKRWGWRVIRNTA